MELGGTGLERAQGQRETQQLVRSPSLWPGALLRVGSWELALESPATREQKHKGKGCVFMSLLCALQAAASPVSSGKGLYDTTGAVCFQEGLCRGPDGSANDLLQRLPVKYIN